MPGIVEDVRDENYKEFTDASASVVAYGLATCEPCKVYDPILEETFSNGKLLLTREGVVEPAELAALISDHLLR
jgi:hypothetical protein